MGVNHFLWNLQKFTTGKSTSFRGALTSCLIQGGGQQGIYQNVLSAHQPHSAADPESPLRPRRWSTHLVWWRPQPQNRSLWSLSIKIQEERRGKRGRMMRRWWGGLKQHRYLFVLGVSSFTLLKHAVRVWMSLHTWRRRGCVTQEEHVRTVEWHVQQVVSLSIPASLHLWPHSHLTSCFLESHPASLTHTLWSHFTVKDTVIKRGLVRDWGALKVKNISEELICLKKGQEAHDDWKWVHIKNGWRLFIVVFIQMWPDCSLWWWKTDRVNCLAPFWKLCDASNHTAYRAEELRVSL